MPEYFLEAKAGLIQGLHDMAHVARECWPAAL
jgi:hypothetical protein